VTPRHPAQAGVTHQASLLLQSGAVGDFPFSERSISRVLNRQ
jgi:hypothetical protein